MEEVPELLLLPLLAELLAVTVDPPAHVALLARASDLVGREHHAVPVDVAPPPHARVQPVLVRLLVASSDQGECVAVLVRHPVGARLLAVPLLQPGVPPLGRHSVFVANLVVLLPRFVAVLATKFIIPRVTTRPPHARARAVAAVELTRVVLRFPWSARFVVPPKAEKELNKNVKHTRHLLLAPAAMSGRLRHELPVFREPLYVSYA